MSKDFKMTKILLTVLFFAVGVTAFGQTNNEEWEVWYDTIYISHKEIIGKEYKLVTDTIISQPYWQVNYVVGTTILYTSSLAFQGYDYGITFDKVENSTDCDADVENESVYELINKIIYIKKTDTLLTIKFNYAKQGFQDILCYFEVVDNEILDLKYIAYGGPGDFMTFNTLTCYIKIDKKYAIEDFSNIKYVMVNGDKNTLVKLENLSE